MVSLKIKFSFQPNKLGQKYVEYQDIDFKICLSLFGWKENILQKQHIVQ